MKRHGLLLTLTEPPPQMEEEFNAWYDSEHIPERLSIPGFRSARRWVAQGKPGEGKYLATYELESPAVLTSPQYLSFFEKQSPWTQRCLGKALPRRLEVRCRWHLHRQVRGEPRVGVPDDPKTSHVHRGAAQHDCITVPGDCGGGSL